MNHPKETCEHCRHSHQSPEWGQRQCRFRAPLTRRAFDINSDQLYGMKAQWPVVQNGDFCGEWQKIPGKVVESAAPETAAHIKVVR